MYPFFNDGLIVAFVPKKRLLFLFYEECNTVLRIDEYADRLTVFYM